MYITEFNGHLSLSMSSVIYCATLHLIAPTLHHIAPTLHQHCTNTAPTLHQHCTNTAPTLHQHCTNTAPTLHQHCTNTTSHGASLHHTAPHRTALHRTAPHNATQTTGGAQTGQIALDAQRQLPCQSHPAQSDGRLRRRAHQGCRLQGLHRHSFHLRCGGHT